MSGAFTDLNHSKQLILQLLGPHGIRAECEARGVKFVGEPNANGWLSCHAVDREDKTPSAAVNVSGSSGQAGRYKDLGGGGKSLSHWDLMALLSPGEFPGWQHALKHFAAQTGVALPGGSGGGGAAGNNGQAVSGEPDSPPEPSVPCIPDAGDEPRIAFLKNGVVQ